MTPAEARVKLIVHAATQAFGDGLRAAEWLAAANAALEGRRPIRSVRERPEDYRTVLRLLARRRSASDN